MTTTRTNTYWAVACPCGEAVCNNWLVEPVAAVQCVRFTKAQAHAVAALLNRMELGHNEERYVPNLDAMDADDLREASKHITRLANYAARKAVAMNMRAGGNITAAIMQEQQCDATYKSLPPEYRW